MKRHYRFTGEILSINGKQFRCIENSADYKTAASADGFLVTRNHRDGTYRGAKCSAGYYQTRIRNRTVYVHILVFEMFVGPVPDEMEIDHIDTDRSNNELSNLRIVTHTQNMRNATTVRKSRPVRLRNAHAASSARRIRVVGTNVLTGLTVGPFASIEEAGRICGVEQSNISAVIRGKLHTAGGYRWAKETAR